MCASLGLEAVRCDVAAKTDEPGETPILAAAERGQLKVVVELLQHLDAPSFVPLIHSPFLAVAAASRAAHG